MGSMGASWLWFRVAIALETSAVSSPEQNCPTVWPGVSQRLYWPVEDPTSSLESAEERLAAFRAARDRIEEMVRTWVEQVEV